MPPLSEAQRNKRKNGIGASDAPAVAGQSPFATPHSVWLDKMGLSPQETKLEVLRRWDRGHKMEGLIVDYYQEDEPDVDVVMPKDFFGEEDDTVFSKTPGLEWAFATSDFLVTRGGELLYNGEVKTGNFAYAHLWGEELTDEIPPWVLCQTHWQMLITESETTQVLYAKDFDGYQRFVVKRNEKLLQSLIEINRRFWENNVKGDVEPEPDHSKASAARLIQLYPGRGLDKSDIITPEDDETRERILELKALVIENTKNKRRQDALENVLKKTVGDHYGIELPGQGKLIWYGKRGAVKTDYKSIAFDLARSAGAFLGFNGAELVERVSPHYTTRAPDSRVLQKPRPWTSAK